MSTQHDRQRAHSGTDLDSSIVISSTVGSDPAGTRLDVVLDHLTGGRHREVMMADFGSGLEPMTDANGDWLYGLYPGA